MCDDQLSDYEEDISKKVKTVRVRIIFTVLNWFFISKVSSTVHETSPVCGASYNVIVILEYKLLE